MDIDSYLSGHVMRSAKLRYPVCNKGELTRDFVAAFSTGMAEKNQPHRTLFTASHVEELPNGPDWELEYLQLSRGPLNYQLDLIDLGDVVVEHIRCDAALHVGDIHTAPYLSFGFITGGESDPKLLGRTIAKREAIVWRPGDAFRYEFVTPDNLTGLIVRVALSSAEQRGWSPRIERYLTPSPQGFRALSAACRRLADQRLPADSTTSNRIMACLELAFGKQLFHDTDNPLKSLDLATQSFVQHARQYLSKLGHEELDNVDALANAMGIERHTLYRAFRQWPGVGPARYSRIQRLANVRKDLLAAQIGSATVTSISQHHGFAHASRFAAEYRDFFGERPSDTLRRQVNP